MVVCRGDVVRSSGEKFLGLFHKDCSTRCLPAMFVKDGRFGLVEVVLASLPDWALVDLCLGRGG